MCRRTPRPKPTSATSSDRTRAIARNSRTLLVLAALVALAAAPAAGTADAPVTVPAILAAYDGATHAAEIVTIETSGTLAGEGLTGAFHTWRSGPDERDDERLGLRSEVTLQRGTRTWIRNANGNVRELRGVLRRHALTQTFIDSGDFVHAPERAHFAGYDAIGALRMWKLEVTADGGDPETLWIDPRSGLPVRAGYVDGDGVTSIDFSDWRDVAGRKIPFHSVTSDGAHAYDIVGQTTFARIGGAIDPASFEPLAGRRLLADRVQTVPLIDAGGNLACDVTIAGGTYRFLVDTGAEGLLLDSRVARRLGLIEQGALEVRGAARIGGLRTARLARLQIGDAALDDLVVSTLDLGSTFSRIHVDGILGYPFFASAVVEIDTGAHTMRFGPPGSFVPAGERIALDVDREIPEATFRINDRVDAPFLVDTGNAGELLLYHPFLERYPDLVAATGRATRNYGVGGSNRSYRTQLDAFGFGSFVLHDRPVDVVFASSGAFADRVDAGNVGLTVLRSFIMTFDLSDSALYLRPATTS